MNSPVEPRRPLDAFEARLLEDLQAFRARADAALASSQVRPAGSRIHRPVLMAAGAVLAAGGVAAAVVLTRPDATELAISGVACADRVDSRPDLTVVASSGESPVTLCAGLWRQGVVAGPSAQVPPLTACVAETGAVVVYPAAGDVCTQLGLTAVPEGFESASATLTAFRKAVTARLDPANGSCPDLDAALAIVRSELSLRRMSGWTVRADDDSSGDCTSIGFEPDTRTIVVSRLQSR